GGFGDARLNGDIELSKLSGSFRRRELRPGQREGGDAPGDPDGGARGKFSCARPGDRMLDQRRLAVSLMSTPANAFETGHPVLAECAWSAKDFASSPGTSASVASSMRVIANPSFVRSMCTLACVSTCRGAYPPLVRSSDRAMLKQLACAAPRSSSGLVPAPFSKRDPN